VWRAANELLRYFSAVDRAIPQKQLHNSFNLPRKILVSAIPNSATALSFGPRLKCGLRFEVPSGL
jgi:hypothetical protein